MNRTMQTACGFMILTFILAGALPVLSPASDESMVDYVLAQKPFRAMRAHGSSPALTRDEMLDAMSGDLVVKKGDVNQDGLRFVYAVKAMKIDSISFWLTQIDREHYDDISENIVDSFIMKRLDASLLNYNILEAPLVSTRHQVLLAEVNTEMYKASDGKVWEHYWNIVTDVEARIAEALAMNKLKSLTPDDLKDAVTVAHNQGSWLMIPLPDGRIWTETYSINDPGGKIPDFIVRRVGGMATKGTSEAYEKWAKEKLPAHVSGAHDTVLSPDGRFMSPAELRKEFGKK